MKRKHTSAAEAGAAGLRVVVVTLDNHLSGVIDRARDSLTADLPGLELSCHAAASWEGDAESLEACRRDIAQGDIILVTMLFMENHINLVLPDLQARREQCDAMVCCMSAAEVMRLTRMGRFRMDSEKGGPIALLKRLRGNNKKSRQSTGAQQLSVLRQLPRILRFIPGTAQDVRAYFLTLQYWLAGSEENLRGLVTFLVDRYATGPREQFRGRCRVTPPVEYPEVGLYHPRMKGGLSDRLRDLPRRRRGERGTVGLLIMRSYALAGNTAHYDRVIEALEARGLAVIPAFSSGLDARPAVERFFRDDQGAAVDAVLSLTGFSLVGGPAYNDADAAGALLRELDVPYLAAHGLEFQSLDQWRASPQGLLPIEATMMVAIPELDGATGPMVFGGRAEADPETARREGGASHDMQPHAERIETLADRVSRLVALRRGERATRRLAIVLFNFPPNAGNTGTAAYLSVFASVFNLLQSLKQQGYAVDLPDSVDQLRSAVVEGNAMQCGTPANVHDRIPADDYVREMPWLQEIEAQWGPAPGRDLSDGRSIMVMGARFGNVLVAVQPGMGYEGDPMRLLFEGSFAPTHAFAGFYHYLRRRFEADAVLHFGTHGALEFMPGKQVGLSESCWPDRLIGDLPNFYLYAANNPSEGLIAKRRAAATLISYLTPPLARCELYSGLLELRGSLDRWRSEPHAVNPQRADLAALIQLQATELDLVEEQPDWPLEQAVEHISKLHGALQEMEQTLIPHGLHVVGQPANREQRIDLLDSIARAGESTPPEREALAALLALAQEAGLAQRIGELLDGGVVNNTENRPALHSLLRASDGAGQEARFAEVQATRERMREWSRRLEQGEHRGFSGRPITDVVNIGIGGSDLGPRLVSEALQPFRHHIRCHYVANVDPADLQDTLRELDPGTTLFIVCSKSFRTEETLTNSLAARTWMLGAGAAEADLERHFLAITTNLEAAADFGITPDNCLPMWDWVGGRYSVWSAVGLSCAIGLGWDNFAEFLAGAESMDRHFRDAPPERNMPLTLSLLEVWCCNFLGAGNWVVLPYDQNLRRLPDFLQQLTMESNGKRVSADGATLDYDTGPVLWGSAGTMGQHSFHQLLHQGTRSCPADFILPLTTHTSMEEQHRRLVANCLAQSRTLMVGRSREQAREALLARGVDPAEAERLAPHLAMPGSRPNNLITFDALTPRSLGALLALYEHRTFCSGQLWGINPFDQWGVELGKEIGGQILGVLSGGEAQAMDASTEAAIGNWRRATGRA